MISLQIVKRAVGMGGHKLSVFVTKPTFKATLCNRIFAIRSFATESHPPQAPVMDFPNYEWQAEQAAVDKLHGRVVEIQKSLDKQTILDQLRSRLTFTSNKIEGNSFTEAEVQQYIQTGVMIRGKSETEHAEIEAHDRAVLMVSNAAKDPLKNLTTVEFVLDLHKVCTPAPREGTDDIIPGKLKTRRNMAFSNINGKPILRRFVAPEDARMELYELLLWTKENADTMPILPFVTILQYNFVRIHPFADTNGRTARLLTALFMLRRSYPPMIIDPELRKEYYNGLAHADHTRDLTPLCRFFARSTIDTYEELIKLQC